MKNFRLCLFLDVGVEEYKSDFVQGFNSIKNPLFKLSVSSRISIHGGVCEVFGLFKGVPDPVGSDSSKVVMDALPKEVPRFSIVHENAEASGKAFMMDFVVASNYSSSASLLNKFLTVAMIKLPSTLIYP
ncbi:hypothetical protein NC652_036371 [Populus alba x Populus x berolinensis]|uniref:Uncharacterized protein n=2 Tax=Populus alba TaxID=43335 RepID=A0A4U5NKG8_POPAL|nr:hypothetical protein NC652_036371 [Populus alba x Populus x berolinensis]TKR84017.1 hypothetical protein D5086_0000260500 [Populus alba]